MKIEDTKSAAGHSTEHEVNLSGGDILSMVGSFFTLSFASMAMGIVIGLICSRILRDINMNYDSVKETLVMMLFAYLGYQAAEACKLSGIISMFCTGLVLAHYAYWNINKRARIGTELAVTSIASLC